MIFKEKTMNRTEIYLFVIAMNVVLAGLNYDSIYSQISTAIWITILVVGPLLFAREDK